MFRTSNSFCSMGRRGQALLVAVLLMMVILLTGILFVAIVSYNQQQAVRSTDVNLAQTLAQAGIQWCDQNLMNSPEGADWRPPFRALDVTAYDADEPETWPIPPVATHDMGEVYGIWGQDTFEQTEDDYYSDFEIARKWWGEVDANDNYSYNRHGFYRLPDLNNATSEVTMASETGVLGGKGHILVRVSYDPDPPYERDDADLIPEGMSAAIKIESIGVVDDELPVYRYLVAYKPIGLTDYMLFVTNNSRSARPAKIGFNPRIDMDNDGWSAYDLLLQRFYGPMRFNTTLALTGDNHLSMPAGGSTKIFLTPQPTSATAEVPGVNPLGITGGYLRDDGIWASGAIAEPNNSSTTDVYERDAGGTISYQGTILPSSNAAYDTLHGLVLDGYQSFDGQGFSRYINTLSSPKVFAGDGSGADRYRALTRDSGRVVALTGGARVNLGNIGLGRGIYVDNKADLQFVNSSGGHDLDALMAEWMQVFPQGQFSAENSGWNDTYTTYAAPGVELTLFPTEQAALGFSPTKAPWPSPTNDPDQVWWPGHVAGEPGIRVRRSDSTWLYYDSVGNRLVDSGKYTLCLDYPAYPNQVLFAEGNVRVHGTLPTRNTNANNLRDYNLTIVSGGTIYIDGQILSPQDRFGRNVGDGVVYVPGDADVPDEYNTKVGLIARDCVCLNPTQLVPQMSSGETSAAPDDPYNPVYDEQHLELSPETVGAGYSQFTFGEPLVTGARVTLAAIHTAADPGPAAMSLNVFDTNTWQPFNFGAPPPPVPFNLDPFKFYFLQPGVLDAVSRPNVERALAPDWSQPVSANDPSVPWDITASLGALTPTFLKGVAFQYADPSAPGTGIGAGATEYWLKRFKIQEFSQLGWSTGSIHAKVNALIYAENGCWFVIPGGYFDSRQRGAAARVYRRYNYDIAVRGAISEAFHADPEMVREWCDKWAYPRSDRAWTTIRYEFDESMRNTRDPRNLRLTTLNGAIRYADTGSTAILGLTTPQTNLPTVPCLPVSEDLVFYGEGQ